MKKNKYWILFFLLLIMVVMMLVSCSNVLYEGFNILEDRTRTTKNKEALEDGASAGAWVGPRGYTYKNKGMLIAKGAYDQLISHSPYDIDVSLGVKDHLIRGRMTDIIIEDAYFEIIYKTGNKELVLISKNRSDWVRNEYKKSVSYATGLKREGGKFGGVTAINFDDLKEVRFYIKYIGIYENGDRRDYWQERYFVPVHTEERRNALEQLARQ